MNTAYVVLRKIIKIVSCTPRNSKHDHRSSLQECFDSSKGTRTRRRYRWKPLVIMFCLLFAASYLFWHRTSPPVISKQTLTISNIETHSTHQDITKSMEQVTQTNKIENIKPTTTEKIPVSFYTLEETLNREKNKYSRNRDDLPICLRKKPYPKCEIKMKSVELSEQSIYPDVKKGGSYQPMDCKTQFKVAIIVPYRNRKRSLGTFLYNIHPFLIQQKLNYQIFVVEQYRHELFNKGRVNNAGFKEMMKFNNFDCVVFHDVDLLPLDERIVYSCPTLPRHMCARVNDTAMKAFNPTYKYRSLFGGVVAVTKEQFQRANGFSNLYFGWGGEDNDLFWRLRAAGYPVVRYNASIGVYLVMPHLREPKNPVRHHLLSRAMDRYMEDGLSNSEYQVISTKFRPLCTHIVVDINPRYENITVLNNKWAR